MRALIDTCVIIDALQNREPFAEDAQLAGVSVAGGVLHNVGQILMAMLLLGTAELGYYLVILAVTGTVAGLFVGLCAVLLIRRIPTRF